MSRYTKIVQNCVVYVSPIPSSVCTKQILSSREWFGRFGVITYIHVNSVNNYAHIRFSDEYCAANAVRIMNNAVYSNGCKLIVTYASIKYCNNFIFGNDCTIIACKYKHKWVNEEDIIESKSNFVCTINLKTGNTVNELMYLFKCLGGYKQYIKYNYYSTQNKWYSQCNVTLPFSTNTRGSDVLSSKASASKKQTAKNMASQNIIYQILQRILPISINIIWLNGSILHKPAYSQQLKIDHSYNQQNNSQNNSDIFNESGSNTSTSMSPPKAMKIARAMRNDLDLNEEINNCFAKLSNLENRSYHLRQQQLLIDEIKQRQDQIVFVGDKHRKFGRLHGETFNDAIWHWFDVYQWIINVRNGKFSNYDQALSINLDAKNICGIKLFKMNQDNLKEIGISDEKDRLLLMEEIKLLSKYLS